MGSATAQATWGIHAGRSGDAHTLFLDKMVQPPGVCTANIHGRALADRSKPFENGYMRCIVRFSQEKPPVKSKKNTVR